MMTPQWVVRLVLVVLCVGLYLAEQGHAPDAASPGSVIETGNVAQQTDAGLKVVFKPDFDQDRPSPAEIDLVASLLPEFLEKWLQQQSGDKS